jgi:hypothetical protein
LANSDKKIILRKAEQAEKFVYSDEIPPVMRNAKISEFRSEPIPPKTKMLGIPYRGTKLKQNSWNFVPNHSVEEKTYRNSVPWNMDNSKLFPKKLHIMLAKILSSRHMKIEKPFWAGIAIKYKF